MEKSECLYEKSEYLYEKNLYENKKNDERTRIFFREMKSV